jgi:nicotinamidase-related amidase
MHDKPVQKGEEMVDRGVLLEEIPGFGTGEWEVPEWSFDGHPALIVNHMQEGIVGSGRFTGCAVEEQRAYFDSHPHVIANQKRLLAAFREKGYPVIFISVVPNPLGFTPKWGFIFRMINRCAPLGHLDNPEVAGLVQVIPELERRPDEPLLCHTGTCLFTGSNLNDVLRHSGVTDLVITGFTAHSTVYNSVIQATDMYYSVVVPADSTGSPGRDAAAGEIVLSQMIFMYGLVTTTEDVIKHL